MNTEPTLRVAVVQDTPVLFDKAATVERVSDLTRRAENADLILFPEAFVPAYPRGLGFGIVVGSRDPSGRALFQRYHEQSLDIPGPETEQMGKAAREADAYLAIGVIEREGGTLYCTLLYFGPDGSLLGKHRKLKPTAGERTIWGEGDGSTLTVIDTPFGRVGGLICWENYMPLARTAMYEKGIDIYLAPTADARGSWQHTMHHIARESGCFVLGCNQYVTKSDYPEDLRAEIDRLPEEMSRGGSVIVSPLGETLAGPLFGETGILWAELDLGEITRARFDFDPVGHYARPDVFRLSVQS